MLAHKAKAGRKARRHGWVIGLISVGFCLVWLGCSAQRYQQAADKEAYGIIKQKSPLVPNMETNFSIETNLTVSLKALPLNTNADTAMGEAGKTEVSAQILSLDKALEVSVKNSRTYQARKETLYLAALSLTMARHRFTPIFSGGVGTGYQGSVNKIKDLQNGVDHVTHQGNVYAGPNLGFDMLMKSGTRIATDFTVDFLRYVVGGGDPRAITSGRLAATITQPLLRGAGYKVTMENLTQAERDMLYALRDFVQYRRENAVQVANLYFRVLQSKDRVRNSWLNYLAFKSSAEKLRAFVQEGQKPVSELGRLEQEEINNVTTWINAIRTYLQALDQFKVQLGLPTDARIVLDDDELNRLMIIHPTITMEDCVRVALASRLDLFTQRDRFTDAARKIDVAKNGLLPDLDVVLQANATSVPGTYLPQLDYSRIAWSGGLNLNLPLDRKSERNTYRTTQINYQRSLRDLELAVDNIKLGVIDEWRQLDEAKRNYESSVVGVDLAQRRVSEQDILEEIGKGNAEAKVAAQNSLLNARNARTAALVSHTIARLSLWRDLGILTIKENGQWEEIHDIVK